MESITLTKDADVVDSESVDRSAEKISKIRELEEKLKVKDASLEQSCEKVSEARQELTKLKDLLAEKDTYIKNVDNLYAEILNRKDQSIEYFNRVTNDDDEVAKGFKRLLMKSLAEKEVQNIKELYNEMKCRNVNMQISGK